MSMSSLCNAACTRCSAQALSAGLVLQEVAAVGVCLGRLKLDEAEKDASMGHQWMGLVLL